MLIIFPDKLKSWIVPLYKAGDPKNCDTYSKQYTYNTLSKILEKLYSLNSRFRGAGLFLGGSGSGNFLSGADSGSW